MNKEDLSARKTGLHQDWQSFRIRCLELAIQAGAGDGAISTADKFGEYILTISDRERLSIEKTLSLSNGER